MRQRNREKEREGDRKEERKETVVRVVYNETYIVGITGAKQYIS